MKHCQICGTRAEADSAVTCLVCGEGTFFTPAAPVAEEAPKPEPRAQKSQGKR